MQYVRILLITCLLLKRIVNKQIKLTMSVTVTRKYWQCLARL